MTDKLGAQIPDDSSHATPGTSTAFQEFFARLKESCDNVLLEAKAIWLEVERVVDQAIVDPTGSVGSSSLDQLKTSRLQLRDVYLDTPLNRLDRTRPQRRLLLALEGHDRKMEEAVRSLPQKVTGSWQDFSLWLNLGRKSSKTPRTIPVRACVAGVLTDAVRPQTRAHDKIVFCVSESLLIIQNTWQAVSLTEGKLEKSATETIHRRWSQLQSLAHQALQELERSSANLHSLLPKAIWKKLAKTPDSRPSSRPRHFEHWEAQIRSSEAELRMARSAEHVWDQIHNGVKLIAQSVEKERTDLISELQRMTDWLTEAIESGHFDSLPVTKARVVPAERRLQDLRELVDREADSLLSNSARLITKKYPPPSREKWAQIYPEQALRSAWVSISQESLEIFEQCEREHKKLLQESERARDVVRFALELQPKAEDGLIGLDALSNALDLLRFQLDEEPKRRFAGDEELSIILPLLFADYQWRTSSNRSAAFAHAVSQNLKRGGRSAGKSLLYSGKRAIRSGLKYAMAKGRDFLNIIGFTHREVTVTSVERRTYLPEQFIRKEERDLPAIYERLFRIEPVEDTRFLIGRSPELDAFMEARQLWERGRSVAILLSGQRGSGKTSLLNCLQNEIDGVEVVRGEFSQRVTSEKAVEAFLLNLLGLEPDADLKSSLLERRRILIIEELERTFLKTIGGFDGITYLQSLVAATCHKTLWILAINQSCFKLLDRVVGLSQRFTHTIQTASASRSDLQSAIMVRHNLSGLRIRFSSRHHAPSRLEGLQRRLTGTHRPSQVFFDRLSEQSTGVYRTALEMWLAHIETVEAGIVYLQPIQVPDLGPLIDGIDLDDLFTVVAVLQHGSLQAEEHATIFDCSLQRSETQLDELISRELLELDPFHPGLRVRPEAMPLVKEALFRRNLL